MRKGLSKIDKQLLEQYRQLCAHIYNVSAPDAETEEERNKAIARSKKDYAFFVRRYFGHIDDFVECGKFHIEAANKVLKTERLKAVMKWGRGHAKSTHFNLLIPIWLMINGEMRVMVSVGKNETDACVKLSEIQAQLENNQKFIQDFGEQKNNGSWEEGEFVTQAGIAFFARGRGQSPRGLIYNNQRPDYICVDDIDDDELALNERRVEELVDWTLQALFPTINHKRYRFIIVGNLFSEGTVLQKVSQRPGTYTMQINARDKNGLPIWPERFSKQELDEIEEFIGWVRFQREYMNNPIKLGRIWKNEHFRWKKMLPLNQYEALILYIDPSWKSNKKSNYKSAKLWGKTKDGELHHIHSFLRVEDITKLAEWVYDLYERTRDTASPQYYMEGIFMQDTLLDEFTAEGKKRKYQLPIQGDYRKKPDKGQRIEAIHPLWVRKFVWYNIDEKDDPDQQKSIQQLMAFGPGQTADDDGPDADEGAIFLLQRMSRVTGFTPYVGSNELPQNGY